MPGYNYILSNNVKAVSMRCLQLYTHPALRRLGDVATTSLCTSQRCCRYVSNETPNNVSMERRQGVSVAHIHDVLLERRNEVSTTRSQDVTTTSHQYVSRTSQTRTQMKHPTTSQWYVSTTIH